MKNGRTSRQIRRVFEQEQDRGGRGGGGGDGRIRIERDSSFENSNRTRLLLRRIGFRVHSESRVISDRRGIIMIIITVSGRRA
jgi:hypothetical protein